MAFIPDPVAPQGAPRKFVPDAPIDPIGAANRAAEQSEHGPVQDVIDMVKAIPGGIDKMLTSIGAGVAAHPLAGNLPALGEALRQITTDPTGTLTSIRNAVLTATPEQIGQNVLAPMVAGGLANAGVGGLLSRAAEGAGAAATEAAPAAMTKFGMRTGAENPIARNVAGASAQPTVTAHNQAIADSVLGAQAGVPPGIKLSPQSLEVAREAPNSVYERTAANIPTGPLSPNAARAVQDIGSDDLIVHSPDTQATIEAQKQRLLAQPMTGSQVVDAQRALRFNGFRNIGSENPEQLAIGSAQLKMADALHQHMVDTLPANAPVSAEQLQQARIALAQNHTIENALGPGGSINLQKLAKVHGDNPGMLTGPMADIAQFAFDHPEVTRLPSVGERFNPSGLVKDVASIDLKKPLSYVQPFFGAAARRALTGGAEAPQVHVTGLGGEFDPIDRTPQPPPGLTASTPQAPPPAAGGPPGQISLADLLSHGVEQHPAEGLSLAPETPPAQGGIPFRPNLEHASGGLSLADELHPNVGTSNADVPKVMSQGVPEGIVTRTPKKPKYKAGDVLKGLADDLS